MCTRLLDTLRRAGTIEPGSDAYGRALEPLVFLELRGFLDYRRREAPPRSRRR